MHCESLPNWIVNAYTYTGCLINQPTGSMLALHNIRGSKQTVLVSMHIALHSATSKRSIHWWTKKLIHGIAGMLQYGNLQTMSTTQHNFQQKCQTTLSAWKCPKTQFWGPVTSWKVEVSPSSWHIQNRSKTMYGFIMYMHWKKLGHPLKTA